MADAHPVDPACAAAFEAWWGGEPDVEVICALTARAAFQAGWHAAQTQTQDKRYQVWLASISEVPG